MFSGFVIMAQRIFYLEMRRQVMTDVYIKILIIFVKLFLFIFIYQYATAITNNLFVLIIINN